MHISGLRRGLALAALLTVAACGKKLDTTAPLAFVPADTPYVFANLEAVPESSRARFQQQVQTAWPVVLEMLDGAVGDLEKIPDADAPTTQQDTAATAARVLKAVLDEIRERDTPDEWLQLGIGQTARVAFYGVGVLPVLRLELADPAAFRAAIARIEQKSGSKLATARIGDQELWTFGSAEVEGVMAIEDKHLVLSLLPTKADEALKRRVLGLDRPDTSLADGGAIEAFNEVRGYLPYGSGWFDTRRLVALFGEDAGVAAFARAAGGEPPAPDATCRAEFDAIAAKMPRLAFGYTALDGARMTMHARLDLEPPLAKALLALGASTPGATSKDALFDLAIALPVLGVRDFLLTQADAVIAAPFKCETLAPLNAGFAEAKPKLEGMLPPPVANLSGLRVTATRLSWAKDADKPDFAGHVAIGSSSPALLVGLAQMVMPSLQQIALSPDGKPVAVPAAALPAGYSDIPTSVAMNDKLLAIAVGTTEVANLGAVAAAAPTRPGTLLETSYSSRVYTLFGDAMDRFGTLMPAEQRPQLDAQRKLYAMYAQWFERFDMRVEIVAEGIDITETIEFAKP